MSASPAPSDDDGVFGFDEAGGNDSSALELENGMVLDVADRVSKTDRLRPTSPSIASSARTQNRAGQGDWSGWALQRKKRRPADIGNDAASAVATDLIQAAEVSGRRPSQHVLEAVNLGEVFADRAASLARSWSGISGVSWLDVDEGTYLTAQPQERTKLLGPLGANGIRPLIEVNLLTYTKEFRDQVDQWTNEWLVSHRARAASTDQTTANILGSQQFQQDKQYFIRWLEKQWADIPRDFKYGGERLGSLEDPPPNPTGYAEFKVRFETHQPEMLNTFLYYFIKTYGKDYLPDLGAEAEFSVKQQTAALELEDARRRAPGMTQADMQQLDRSSAHLKGFIEEDRAKAAKALSTVAGPPKPFADDDDFADYWASQYGSYDNMHLVGDSGFTRNGVHPLVYYGTDDDDEEIVVDEQLETLRKIYCRVVERIRRVQQIPGNEGVDVLYGAGAPAPPLTSADQEVYTFFTTTSLMPRVRRLPASPTPRPTLPRLTPPFPSPCPVAGDGRS